MNNYNKLSNIGKDQKIKSIQDLLGSDVEYSEPINGIHPIRDYKTSSPRDAYMKTTYEGFREFIDSHKYTHFPGGMGTFFTYIDFRGEELGLTSRGVPAIRYNGHRKIMKNDPDQLVDLFKRRIMDYNYESVQDLYQNDMKHGTGFKTESNSCCFLVKLLKKFINYIFK